MPGWICDREGRVPVAQFLLDKRIKKNGEDEEIHVNEAFRVLMKVSTLSFFASVC